MPYAILRFAKRKAGGLSSCYAHNERKKEIYKSNPDIDTSRKEDNYHLVLPKQTYTREVKRLIAVAGCKTRKDSTVMVETIITASPEFMSNLSPPEQREYFTRALTAVGSRVGNDNIISAVVHMDEKTPHMHLSFCPIVQNAKGGKSLSAKALLGNQATLSQWQTYYHAAMSEKWPELERGISSQITKRKHIPVWLFKTAERLDKQLAEVEKAIEGINPLNTKKQREQAMSVLEKWFPQAERFTAQVKTIDDHIKSLERAKQEAEKKAYETEQSTDSRVDAAVSQTQAAMQRRIVGKDKELEEAYKNAKALRERISYQKALIDRVPITTLKPIVEKVQALQAKNKNERER